MKKWRNNREDIKRKQRILACRIREKGEGLKGGLGKIRKRGKAILKDTSGISTIEMLLILVVIIALILIFKNQLIDLVNTIFDKITSESAGI